ncbi:prepilin peptidase [Clostridium hydrogenum]|uniref:prepilin peptidase n=1 Tax=Clostridium hydrogenum TaxID=2855764 RepID=UPI002E308AEC|nr:prepilin peptidase [Clostridium hydrogenum]
MGIVLIFICGFFAASILEWIAYKVPKEEKVSLKDKLKNYCRYAKKITNKYAIIACLMGIVYCMFYVKYKVSIDFLRYSLVCSVLFIVAIIDYKTQNVYFSTTASAAVLSIIFILLNYMNGRSIKTYIFGGIAIGIFSSILAVLNVIGWGDVEILIVCGLLVGTYKVIIVAFISIILCGGYGVFNMIRKDSKVLRTAFGPYILISLIGVIIAMK